VFRSAPAKRLLAVSRVSTPSARVQP
jgi:hypothetical protein